MEKIIFEEDKLCSSSFNKRIAKELDYKKVKVFIGGIKYKLLKVEFAISATEMDTGYHLIDTKTNELLSSEVYDGPGSIYLDYQDEIESIQIGKKMYFPGSYQKKDVLKLFEDGFDIYLLIDTFPQLNGKQMAQKFKDLQKLEWCKVAKINKAFIGSPFAYVLTTVRTRIQLPFEFRTLKELEQNNISVVSAIRNENNLLVELREVNK